MVPLVVFLGMLPFLFHDGVALNVLSHETYRGDSRGFEVTLVDFVALILWAALPRAEGPLPYRLALLGYLGAALLSTAFAAVPLYACFSVWKILRGLFLFAVVVRVCANPSMAPQLVKGFGLGLVCCFAYALVQRYAYGAYRPSGFAPHANSFGMAANLVSPIAAALLLGGQRTKLAVAAAVSGPVAVVLTLSRASLVLYGVAMAAVLVGSVVRGLSLRKVGVVVAGSCVALAVFGYAAPTIVERFDSAPEGSARARERWVEIAAAMVHDHPLGIGINQFSHVSVADGYADRYGSRPGDRDGLAHHVYWLTAAELGPHGLIAYLVLLAMPLLSAFRGAASSKGDVRGDVLLGCGVGLGVMYLQGLFEWAARQTALTYLFFMFAALVACLARDLRPGRPLRSQANGDAIGSKQAVHPRGNSGILRGLVEA
jgi:hypothetical protein